MSKIIDRILKRNRLPALLEQLKKLKPTDQQSLLLELFKERTLKLSPAQVLKQYETNRFVKPSSIKPLKVTELETLCYKLLPETFDAIRFSPISPLGSCSVLGTVDQNKVLSTIRNTEICSDPTNTMALETALRRKKNPNFSVRLATCQQLVRTQRFENPSFTSHFTVFAVTSGGKRDANYQSLISELETHISFYIDLLKHSINTPFPKDFIKIKLTPINEALKKRVNKQIIEPLSKKSEYMNIQLDCTRKSGSGYYKHLSLAIELKSPEGKYFKVIDGGDTDWTGLLLSNRKEYFLTSCVGIELFCWLISPYR